LPELAIIILRELVDNSLRGVEVVRGEPYIKAVSIPEAYVNALRFLRSVKGNSIDHLIIVVEKPLLPTLTLTEDSDIIASYEKFLNFESSRDPSGNTLRAFHEEYKKLKLGDKSGEEWIQDRIKVLCPSVKELMEEVRRIIRNSGELLNIKRRYCLKYREEEYKQRLMRYGYYGNRLSKYLEIGILKEGINQLAVIIYRLIKHQTSFAYGTLSVLDPIKDCLQLLCDERLIYNDKKPGPIKYYPCLTALDVKLRDNVVNLCALWRHQYFDTKAYGNIISLAMLLKEICDLVNYFRRESGSNKMVKYGKITSIACRADFSKKEDSEDNKRKVLNLLRILGD